jgi:hypothetical protein
MGKREIYYNIRKNFNNKIDRIDPETKTIQRTSYKCVDKAGNKINCGGDILRACNVTTKNYNRKKCKEMKKTLENLLDSDNPVKKEEGKFIKDEMDRNKKKLRHICKRYVKHKISNEKKAVSALESEKISDKNKYLEENVEIVDDFASHHNAFELESGKLYAMEKQKKILEYELGELEWKKALAKQMCDQYEENIIELGKGLIAKTEKNIVLLGESFGSEIQVGKLNKELASKKKELEGLRKLRQQEKEKLGKLEKLTNDAKSLNKAADIKIKEISDTKNTLKKIEKIDNKNTNLINKTNATIKKEVNKTIVNQVKTDKQINNIINSINKPNAEPKIDFHEKAREQLSKGKKAYYNGDVIKLANKLEADEKLKAQNKQKIITDEYGNKKFATNITNEPSNKRTKRFDPSIYIGKTDVVETKKEKEKNEKNEQKYKKLH